MTTFAPFTDKVGGLSAVKLIDFPVDLAQGVSGSTNLATRVVDTTTFDVTTLKITPSGSGAYLSGTNGNRDWRAYEALGLEYYVDTYDTNCGMTMHCVEDDAWTVDKNIAHTTNSTNTNTRGRHFVVFRHDQTNAMFGPYVGGYPFNAPSGWATSGGALGAQATLLRNFRITFSNWHTNGRSVYLKALWGMRRMRPKVVLYFDNWQGGNPGADYDAAHTAIRPTIGQGGYGWKWGVTIPLDEIGNTGNGPVSVLQELEAEGCEAVCNDVTDRNMATAGLTLSQAIDAMSETRETLAGYGLNRGNKIWVWNNNAYNSTLLEAAQAVGIQLGRAGISERTIFDRSVQAPTAQELLRVGSIGIDNAESSVLKSVVTRAITYGGDLHMYWHTFAPGGSASLRPSVNEPAKYANGLTTYTAAFLDFAAWLRARELEGLVDVVSPSQWYSQLTQPTLVA
jgi:hypothetical protein